MKKKYNRLAVFIESDDGKMYQALLDKNEMYVVSIVISQLHKGEIKVLDEEFDSLHFDTPTREEK